MATGNKNNKSDKKAIRFPHEIVAGIESSVESEKADNPNASFSSWVLDACGKKLKAERRKAKAEAAED